MRSKSDNSNPPILREKRSDEPSVFRPENLLREAKRQKNIESGLLPEICILDPDGDILKWLIDSGNAKRSSFWACYHTDLFIFSSEGREYGIIGNAVGAPFAVLLAEQLFISGCKLLINITSAGQIATNLTLPCFILVTKALRDEGTSYHYLEPSDYSNLSPRIVEVLDGAFDDLAFTVNKGATWTTDAPYRETESAISAMKDIGILAVEMESAALYAFSAAKKKPVVSFAHITNQMAQNGADFEKGDASGALASISLISAVANALYSNINDLP